MTLRRPLFAALALAAVACAAMGCAAALVTMPASAPSRLRGQAAAAFARPTVQGGRFETAATPAGPCEVVEFFGLS